MPLGLYDTGTISIAPADTSVTGTGVDWRTIKEWDFFIAGGAMALVEEPTNAPTYDEITFKGAWRGPTLTTQPYQIIKFPTGWLETSQRVRDIFDQLANVAHFHKIEDGESPAPNLGEDDQFAIRPVDWTVWKKIAGVWTIVQDAPLAGMLGDAWVATTPVPTASTGSITTASSVLHTQTVGKRTAISGHLTITTAGTGAAALKLPLPTTPAVSGAMSVVDVTAGVLCLAYVTAGDPNLYIFGAAFATVIASGKTFRFGGVYENT